MILWTVALAAAAPLEDYARRAPVALPEAGVVVIEVPAELLDPVFGAAETDLLLVDAAGVPVPTARVVAGASGDRVVADTQPGGPGTWDLTGLQRSADTVVVRLPPRRAGTVTVYSADQPISEPTRVWNLPASSQVRVPLFAPTSADLRVVLSADPPAIADYSAEVEAWTGHTGPRPEVRPAPVTDLGWIEGGAHRYEVAVPADLPVEALLLDPEQDIFDRKVGAVRGAGDLDPGDLRPFYSGLDATLSRSAFGGGRLDLTRVAVVRAAGDRFEVTISGEPPLTFSEVGLEVPGAWLIARDAGPGPHTLYGAGPALAGAGDLQVAVDELLREAGSRVAAGPPEPNPVWVPPERGISEPGNAVDLVRMTVERPVIGEGLSAVPLDPAVLGAARADLGDLRLVDSEGRGIPYLLRERAGGIAAGDAAFERTEAGDHSRLRVPLAQPNLPIRSITLVTSANAFSREVTVLRARAASLEPVRAWNWTSQAETQGLTLALYERFGDEIIVRIDNGDDAPLPIERIVLHYPAWELVAVLPPGGASLVYGDPRTPPPSYDLNLVRGALLRRVPALASMGEPRARVSVAPPLDRALAGVGVLVLAVGLLVLVGTVLRAVPPQPET